MTDRQRNGFILLLVLGLLAASFAVIVTHQTRLGLDLKGGVELVYQGQPTPQTPVVTQDALSRAVDIMRERVDQLGVAEPEIQTSGANQITVGLPNVKDIARAEKQVGTTAQLAFYDWEANAITPNGKTGRQPARRPGPEGAHDQPGNQRRAGNAGRGQHGAVRRGQVGRGPARAELAGQCPARQRVLLFGAPGQRGLRDRRQGAGQDGHARRPLPALRARRQPAGSELRSAGGGERLGGCRAAGDQAGHGGGPGLRSERLPHHQLQRPDRAVLRAQGPRRAARHRYHQPDRRAPTPAATPTSRSAFSGNGATSSRTSRARSPSAARP